MKTIEGIFKVIKKDSIEWNDYNMEYDYEVVEVYAVRDDKNGYPHFLIYENGEWKYKSAKYFTTEVKIKFETNTKIDKWVENHRKQGCISHATAGEQFVYEFLPSGIVECQTVRCLCCKEEFTDYVD